MRVYLKVLLCGVLCAGALVLPGAAGAALGFAGPGYAGTSGPPTTSKPESKLWWNDGFWWASMYSKSDNAYTIHRLTLRTQRWANTGVVVDPRESTRQDALSLGGKLFIASHKYRPKPVFDDTANANRDGMRLYRFSYNSGQNRYTSDGAPHVIDAQRVEALTIERDTSGRIVATWARQASAGGPYQVHFAQTSTNCTTQNLSNCAFGGPTVFPDEVGADDISAIVRFGNSLGIMWSDSPESKMMFSVNGGNPEPVGAATGFKLAEDHINLKAAGSTVYAAVKTKFRSARNPGIRLLVRSSSGNWGGHQVTNAGFRHTRPIVLITGSRVRVFSQGGADVFMKTARRSTLNFPGGAGTRVLDAGNPTSTKQNLSGRTQLIVVGADHDARRYRHMYTQLARCVRSGTAGNDRICGNGRNNRLNGRGGNDVILGRGGNDRIVGGSGRDRLSGGSGRDTFVARDRTRDVLKGGGGRDRARVDRNDVRRSIEALF